MNRTKLSPETLITITRTVKGTESRQVITESVAEALRLGPADNDFSTTNGTVLVTARLASDTTVGVGFDGANCYIVEDSIPPHPVGVDPAEILDARTCAGLTQTEAAALIGKTLRAWQYWEAGQRQMDKALFELFNLKTAHIYDARIADASKFL